MEAALQLAGAHSVSISDAADSPLLEPEPGTTPIWPTVVLSALFADDADLTRIEALFADEIADAAFVLEPVADEDWVHAWQQSVEPVRVRDVLEIVPAERPNRALQSHQLALHMGLAFGTGQHPTTLLCLNWIADHMPQACHLLDYGTGSGILAIAALRLGAKQVYAVDYDVQALSATRNNAALNQVLDSIWIGEPAALPAVEVEVIVANILAKPLCSLAKTLAVMQPATGMIALSGLLESQLGDVEGAYAEYYESFEQTELNGWALLTGRRRSERNAEVRPASR